MVQFDDLKTINSFPTQIIKPRIIYGILWRLHCIMNGQIEWTESTTNISVVIHKPLNMLTIYGVIMCGRGKAMVLFTYFLHQLFPKSYEVYYDMQYKRS